MAVIDSTKQEINLKIIYYGPAEAGKSTSLSQLQNLIHSNKKSRVTKKDQTEKTLFFDFIALSSDQIGGYKTRFQVYTVPGDSFYEDSRKYILKGVDGIIFVADSQIEKLQSNLDSLKELTAHLEEMGYTLKEIPIVIQYNKRDLKYLPEVDDLRRAINQLHVPDFESVATKGDGVVEAFQECVRQVVGTLSHL